VNDIQELGLPDNQTERLRAHGITTVQEFGRSTEGDLIGLLGEADAEHAIDLYSQWFAKNICPPLPPLPDDWKPFQWGEV